jgi:hypothetical protein
MGLVALTAARKSSAKRARRPRFAGSSASRRPRIDRASTGAVPPLAMAMVTGSRSTMAGQMKVQSEGRSTTLTGTPAARATAETRASSAASSLAETTSSFPETSSASKERCWTRIRPRFAASLSSAPGRLATTTTRAPASASSAALRAAPPPPPTTRTSRSLTSRNKGKCCIASARINMSGMYYPDNICIHIIL